MRILIVEDDPLLNKQLTQQMRDQGFAVESALDGEEGLHFALEYPIDVAIIDLGLPKIDGIELIKKVRDANKKFPVLILTAQGRWQEKVSGLEAGADDYVVKPFQPEELIARLNALLRRSGGWANSKLSCGPITLDLSTKQVTCSNRPIELTAFEYKVLAYMMLHAGRTISKSELTEHLYEEDQERDSNVLEVIIRRLRQKMDPKKLLNPIETQRGHGYRFVLSRNEEEAHD